MGMRILTILLWILHVQILSAEAIDDDCILIKEISYEDRVLTRSCFRLYQENATWDEASQRCVNDGGLLVRIPDATLQANLSEALVKNQSLDTVWIGASKTTSENWFWDNDIKWDYLFKKWSGGEPSDGTDEGCVFMNTSTQLWHEDNCNLQASVICQRDAAVGECIVNSSQVFEYYFNGVCYSIHLFDPQDSLSYYKAKETCRQYVNGTVVRLDSQPPYDETVQHILDLSVRIQEKNITGFWIGLYRVWWAWVGGDVEFEYSHWAVGEPDQGVCAVMENTTTVQYPFYDHHWRATNCDNFHSYLCDITQVITFTTEAPTTEALTTEAPSTEAPTTQAPNTEAIVTNQAQTTEAVVTTSMEISTKEVTVPIGGQSSASAEATTIMMSTTTTGKTTTRGTTKSPTTTTTIRPMTTTTTRPSNSASSLAGNFLIQALVVTLMLAYNMA